MRGKAQDTFLACTLIVSLSTILKKRSFSEYTRKEIG